MTTKQIIKLGKELIKEYEKKIKNRKCPKSTKIACHWMATGIDQLLQKIKK